MNRTVDAGPGIATVEFELRRECQALSDFLVTKNRDYGNSAFEGARVFSGLEPLAALNVRIDDKLRRIANATKQGRADNEDSELDLIGYLVLKRVHRRLQTDTAEE